MLPWKERLYAFLLRRVLGPWLDERSLELLHNSVEVSLQDGTLVLKNVGLNTEFVTEKLLRKRTLSNHYWRIQQASLERLDISLSLEQHGTHDGTSDDGEGVQVTQQEGSLTLAWRAATSSISGDDGSSSCDQSAKIALVTKVVLVGLVVHVEPDDSSPDQNSDDDSEGGDQQQPIKKEPSSAEDAASATASSSFSSYLNSYLDAALASLRLSVQLQNFSIRLQCPSYSPKSTKMSFVESNSTSSHHKKSDVQRRNPSWVELRIKSASYHDVDADSRRTPETTETIQSARFGASVSSYSTVMHKSLDLTKVSISVGGADAVHDNTVGELENDDEHVEQSTPSISQKFTTILLLDGVAKLKLRAIEYKDKTVSPRKPQHSQIQHDVELFLGDRLCLFLDQESLHRVNGIVRSLQQEPDWGRESTEQQQSGSKQYEGRSTSSKKHSSTALSRIAGESGSLSLNHFSDISNDEADVKVIEDFVEEQYREARLRAERNEVRGGLLLPTATTDGGVSFDAFFDANDQSFYHYSHMLSESQTTATTNAFEGGGTFVHTKLRCHLNSGQAKLVLSSSASNRTSDDVYLLMTMSDVQASSTLSNLSSNHTLSIAYIEVENATAPAAAPQNLQVASVLCFPTTDNHRIGDAWSADTGDNTTGEALLQAPCISVAVATSTSTPDMNQKAGQRRKEQINHRLSSSTPGDLPTSEKTIDLDVEIEPFVVSCPMPLLNSVSEFLSSARSSSQSDSTEGPSEQDSKDDAQSAHFSLRCSCAHFDLAIPLELPFEESCADILSRLCSRAGAPVSRYFLNNSAIGFHGERLSISVSNRSGPASNETMQKATEASFGIQHGLVYFFLHSSSDEEHRLFDIASLSGELEPAILRMSNSCQEEITSAADKEAQSPSSDITNGANTPALQLFPLVPAISSFKAFQEDDDDDDGFPKSDEFKLWSRREIRGTDPQPRMMDAASKATKLAELEIPHISADVTVDEIILLAELIAKLQPMKNAPTPKTENAFIVGPTKPTSRDTFQDVCAIGITLKHVRLAVHGEPNTSDVKIEESVRHSYLINFDGARAHLLRDGCGLKHVRALTQDFTLSEAVDLLPAVKVSGLNSSLQAEERDEVVRSRACVSSKSRLAPIIHRSHLFTPISRQSPAILFDILDLSDSRESPRKSLHFTLYDITHRFDFDSQWIGRLASMAHDLSSRIPKRNVDDQPETVTAESSLTRVFFCVADCNVDYTSPSRWKAASRTLLRLGEVRVSCNLVRPSPTFQSIKLSVGDVSLYLCNSRFQYKFEDSRIYAAHNMVTSGDLPLLSQTAEDVQRDMNLKTIVMLDSLDAVATAADGSRPKADSQPGVNLSVSAGEFSLFACKDSFALFVGSVGELCAEACAMSDKKYQELRRASEAKSSKLDNSQSQQEETAAETKDTLPTIRLQDLMKQSALRPALGTANTEDSESSFLLDGYDWTTIDQDVVNASGIPRDDEQSAKWYGSDKRDTRSIYRTRSHEESDTPEERKTNPFQIITHHFPLQPTSDPLGDGDMGALRYSGAGTTPLVKTRVLVSDLSLKLRLFDGYDWPENLHKELRNAERKGSFLIDLDADSETEKADSKRLQTDSDKREETGRKAALMASLLDGPDSSEPSNTFQDILLPEERKARLRAQGEARRLGRRSDKYFQFSASGIQLRNDSMIESESHRLSSCLNLKLQDFFAAETISSSKPIKLAGEWFSDIDHPRDTRDGLFMMKMVTWNAEHQVAPNGKLVNDECEAAVKILPLRCFLDQKAIRFVSAFFRSDLAGVNDHEEASGKEEDENSGLPEGLHAIPPPTFLKFVFKPLKLKVNYKPEKLDQTALRNGQIVELLNLSPLESLVITLDQVEINNVVGFGEVLSVVVPTWIQHVSSTQLMKFLEYSQPLEPLTQIGGGLADMMILPLEAIRKGGNVKRAFQAGANSFGLAFAYQTLTLTSSAAEMVAAMGGSVSAPGTPGNLLPSRPVEVPAGMTDTVTHVVESLSRGFQVANSRIVIIPFREYQRNGTTGMVTSVVRGIPVAITAPASGAAEAISYALIGMRNSLRPDIRRELEASQRGLRFNG
mmetsp:Transcript_14413/g.31451  ORF Transcript_14413/g.31451 Transcript_14413/m.31451 type:complete len:2077 (-) Transcript_14413:90-6320(-)